MLKSARGESAMEEINSPNELPPTPFLFKTKIECGGGSESPGQFEISKSNSLKANMDSLGWLDDEPETTQSNLGSDQNELENDKENLVQERKDENIAASQKSDLTKPIKKFRLSESFFLPQSNSPPHNPAKEIGTRDNIPMAFCGTEELDIKTPMPETPLAKYYLSRKKKSRISELISTLSVADASNGEMDLKLDQIGGATRDNNYSNLLNEPPELLDFEV